MRAVPAERDPLLSILAALFCSSTRLSDDAASQIPVRGARCQAGLIVDDPMAMTARCSPPSPVPLPGASGGTGGCISLRLLLPEVLPPPPDLIRPRSPVMIQSSCVPGLFLFPE
jgi:hypothetical protein